MNKCLITKLNGIVDNDAIIHLNETRLILENGSESLQEMRIQCNGVVLYKSNVPVYFDKSFLSEYQPTNSDSYITIGVPANQKVTISIYANTRVIRQLEIKQGVALNFNTENIEGKCSIERLYCSGTAILDIDNPIFLSAYVLQNPFGKWSGHLSNLSSTIEELHASGGDSLIKGSLSDIKSTSITRIWVDFTPNISGSIEDFVKSQVAKGRTEGTVDIMMHNDVLTYNGNFANRVLVNFTDTGATVSGTGVQTGTYTKSTDTWAYAS